MEANLSLSYIRHNDDELEEVSGGNFRDIWGVAEFNVDDRVRYVGQDNRLYKRTVPLAYMMHTVDAFRLLQGAERFGGAIFDPRGKRVKKTHTEMRMSQVVSATLGALNEADNGSIRYPDRLEEGKTEIKWNEEPEYNQLPVEEKVPISKTLEKMERRSVRESRSKDAARAADTLKDQDFSTGKNTPKTTDLMKHVKSQYFEIDRKLKEATNDTEGIPLYEIDWKNKDTILEILSGGGSSAADTAAQAGEDMEAGETDMTDLFEYYGSNIEHAATDLPELKFDDSYKSAEGTTEISVPADTMEKMSDGIALAGPFFTVDKEGTIVGESYGGNKYAVCGITVGMPISEAAEIAKSHGFNFSNAEIAHGTAKYVAIYDNGEAQLCITSDADGVFGKTEESDVTGNVDNILITKK